VFLPKIVEIVPQVKGNRYKGRDGIFIAWMRVILETVGKNPPSIQANITKTFVLASSYSSTHLSQVDRVLYDLGICVYELPTNNNL